MMQRDERAASLYLEWRKQVASPSREKAGCPRCATANEADSRALPCCGLKLDNAYKGFTFGTGIADLYAGIELHGERRSFYAVPSDVLPGQRCAQEGRLLGSDAGGDCICWVGGLGNEIELDAP